VASIPLSWLPPPLLAVHQRYAPPSLPQRNVTLERPLDHQNEFFTSHYHWNRLFNNPFDLGPIYSQRVYIQPPYLFPSRTKITRSKGQQKSPKKTRGNLYSLWTAISHESTVNGGAPADKRLGNRALRGCCACCLRSFPRALCLIFSFPGSGSPLALHCVAFWYTVNLKRGILHLSCFTFRRQRERIESGVRHQACNWT